MILPAFGSLLLLVWFKVFLPTHIEMRRTKNSMTDTRGEAKGGKVLGCFSIAFFLGGFLSLLVFFATCEVSEEVHVDHTRRFQLSGCPILLDSAGLPVVSLDVLTDSFPMFSAKGQKTKIEFINHMDFPIRVLSKDRNGSVDLYYLNRNFATQAINCYEGQTWLVTKEAGKPLLYFFAEKRMEGEVGSAWVVPDYWEEQ